MRKSILIIGAVPHPDNLQTYGGTTTLMQNFLDFCGENGYPYQHIDTLKYKNRLLNLLYFGMRFLWGILTCKIVMYNVSYNGAFSLFYHTASLAYLCGCRVVFRKFGGNFLQQLENCPSRKRLRMLALLNKASLIFFETNKLVKEASEMFVHPERIHWFPNCRKKLSVSEQQRTFQRRFVFISHLREDKGVDLILNAAEKLPDEYVVHLYGSVYDKKYKALDYFEEHKVKYCGALKSEEVLPVLRQYDVLLLPTYCKTEGYPGIIIEALSLGIPVITTPIGGIPEMISNGENGFLISPCSVKALLDAMLEISSDNYGRLALNARETFNNQYSSDIINVKVYKELMSLQKTY